MDTWYLLWGWEALNISIRVFVTVKYSPIKLVINKTCVAIATDGKESG